VSLPPVYSSQLIQVTLVDGGTAVYDVLPLTRVVVTDVLCTFEGFCALGMTFALALGLSAELLHWDTPAGWVGTRHWSGRAVLIAGDVLTASFAGPDLSASAHVHVSGFTLQAP